MTSTNKVHDRIENSFNKQNFLTLIGAKLESVEEGKVVISCSKKDVLTQQQGFIHGGVVTSIADVTCGYTALSVMPDNYEVLTVEFKINLLRPGISDKIIATGSILKAGKKLVITEAIVTDESGEKTIAKMIATMIPTEVLYTNNYK